MKFLGLPSSKLHLSGRKPTALNDQELVQPLLYDKNPDEIVKKTGNVLLFMNRSDSESNATGTVYKHTLTVYTCI